MVQFIALFKKALIAVLSAGNNYVFISLFEISECVSIALVMQHDRVTHYVYCHLWPLRLYNNLSTLSGHIMYSTATEANYDVKNIYTMGVQFFYAKGQYPFLWAGSRAASESITVGCIPKRLNYFVNIIVYRVFYEEISIFRSVVLGHCGEKR